MVNVSPRWQAVLDKWQVQTILALRASPLTRDAPGPGRLAAGLQRARGRRLRPRDGREPAAPRAPGPAIPRGRRRRPGGGRRPSAPRPRLADPVVADLGAGGDGMAMSRPRRARHPPDRGRKAPAASACWSCSCAASWRPGSRSASTRPGARSPRPGSGGSIARWPTSSSRGSPFPSGSSPIASRGPGRRSGPRARARGLPVRSGEPRDPRARDRRRGRGVGAPGVPRAPQHAGRGAPAARGRERFLSDPRRPAGAQSRAPATGEEAEADASGGHPAGAPDRPGRRRPLRRDGRRARRGAVRGPHLRPARAGRLAPGDRRTGGPTVSTRRCG